MNIVFRADASVIIGSGHVMRCLTLADYLHKKGANIAFASRVLDGHLCNYIERRGYRVFRLSQKDEQLISDWEIDYEETKSLLESFFVINDWLVVDHYNLDYRWEAALRPLVKKIMIIDDLANRRHECDILLDQNLYENMEKRYKHLVPDHCLKFLGPAYALLRPEFIDARKKDLVRNGNVNRIMIFFGGSDPTHETLKALKASSSIYLDQVIIDVVVGQSNPLREKIRQACLEYSNVSYHCQTDKMAALMAEADLFIGSGGASTWERCYLGLPSLTIITAGNQKELTQVLARRGIVINLGMYNNVTQRKISSMLYDVIKNPELLISMSNNALDLMNSSHEGIEDLIMTIYGG